MAGGNRVVASRIGVCIFPKNSSPATATANS